MEGSMQMIIITCYNRRGPISIEGSFDPKVWEKVINITRHQSETETWKFFFKLGIIIKVHIIFHRIDSNLIHLRGTASDMQC